MSREAGKQVATTMLAHGGGGFHKAGDVGCFDIVHTAIGLSTIFDALLLHGL